MRVDAEKGLVIGSLEIDANTTNGPQVRPIDAEVSLRWPEKPDARAARPSWPPLGLMRIPFGYEVQELDYVRPFLERATMLQALFPGEFDLGARFKMKYRFLDLALAVMNGNPIGDKVFPDLDPVQAKDMVGRLGVDVEVAPGVRFQAGVSGDTGTGFHPGTPATKNAARLAGPERRRARRAERDHGHRRHARDAIAGVPPLRGRGRRAHHRARPAARQSHLPRRGRERR